MEKKEATYQYCEAKHGNGMFFYTSCCGNRMYSIDSNPMKYHGCLCPKCFWQGKLTTLYLKGIKEDEYDQRRNNQKSKIHNGEA